MTESAAPRRPAWIDSLTPGRFQLLAAAAALAMRLACLYWWEAGHYTAAFGYDPYVTYAQSWLGWIPPMVDAAHSPGYTLWAAAVFLVLRAPDLLAIQLLNVLFGCLLCNLLYRWARLMLGEPLARRAALWAAVDPLLVFFSVQLQSETFYAVVQMSFFLALARCEAGAPWLRGLGVGVLGGLASFTRSVFALYPIPLLPVLYRQGRRTAFLLALLAGWSLPLLLWGVRNQLRYHAFIPLSAGAGWSVWEGFTLDREEIRRRPLDMFAELKREKVDTVSDVRAGSEYFKAKWLRYVKEDPLRAAGIVAGKALSYWRPWPYDPHSRPVRALLAVYFSVLFFLAVVGGWALRGNTGFLMPVAAFFVYMTALHSVFFTSLRYRLPLEPFLCALAAAGLSRLLQRRGSS